MTRLCSPLLSLSAVCVLAMACDPAQPVAPDTLQADAGLPDGMTISKLDRDGDGVAASDDCDDADPRIGELIYESDLSKDDGNFTPTEQLGEDWVWEGGGVYATDGGQEAMLADESLLRVSTFGVGGGRFSRPAKNYVVMAEVSARGTEPSCGYDCLEVCGEYEPDDCYTDYQAIALGILDVEITGNGKATLSNSGDYDVCLEGFAMWDHPGSQSIFVGPETLLGKTFRIEAGKSLDVYYGSWTTDNGKYSPHKGEPDFWCYQNGTTLKTGNTYSTVGAWLPEDMQDLLWEDTDLDGDGVYDKVDWEDSNGVQAQHNVWDYQRDHAAVAVGKLASSTGDGTIEVSLTLQNRGAKKTTATMTDTVPYGWSLVSCDVTPDSETRTDSGWELSWEESLDGCTKDCSIYDELVVTCEIASTLSADQDIVELPAASAAYFDGDDDEVSESMPAAAFGYDYDADGTVMCGTTDRWRAGVLLRAAEDADQDEGYHGYRCALGHNAPGECFDPGHFLQIAEFMDAPEDGIASECEGSCDNSTFDQLARVDHTGDVDLGEGDSATLTFWVHGSDMYCSATDSSGKVFVEARATDASFATGTTGLSTLNMYGEYDSIKVCETLATR